MVKAENSTLRDEFIKNFNKIEKVDKLKHQVDDAIGSLEESLKRDIKPELEELTSHLNKLEAKFNSDSKSKDTSLRSLVSNFEEQIEDFDKFQKKTTKKLNKLTTEEKLDELRVEISKGKILIIYENNKGFNIDYIHKVSRVERSFGVDSEQIKNTINVNIIM